MGEAIFDFEGTSSEVWGNINAPKAVTMSAIIYCLRCLVGHDIPLNQGCLNPVTVIIPPGSMLDPSENAAVVGKIKGFNPITMGGGVFHPLRWFFLNNLKTACIRLVKLLHFFNFLDV